MKKNFWKRVHLNSKSLFSSLSSSTLFSLSSLPFLSCVLILVLFPSNIRSFILLYTFWRNPFPPNYKTRKCEEKWGEKREEGKNSRKTLGYFFMWLLWSFILLLVRFFCLHHIQFLTRFLFLLPILSFSLSFRPFFFFFSSSSISLTTRLSLLSLSLFSPVVLLLTMLITFINHQDSFVCIPSLSPLFRVSKLGMRSKLWLVHFWPWISLQTILYLTLTLSSAFLNKNIGCKRERVRVRERGEKDEGERTIDAMKRFKELISIISGLKG